MREKGRERSKVLLAIRQEKRKEDKMAKRGVQHLPARKKEKKRGGGTRIAVSQRRKKRYEKNHYRPLT